MIYVTPVRNMITYYVSEVPLMDINAVLNRQFGKYRDFHRSIIAERLFERYELVCSQIE